MFGMCLTATEGGVLDMGFIDSSKYVGTMQWVPMRQERYYSLPLVDITISTTSIGLPAWAYAYNNMQAGSYVDSGAGVMIVSPAIFGGIQAVMQSELPQVPFVSNQTANIFNGYCPTIAEVSLYWNMFPPIQFVFQTGDGRTGLTLDPPAYFLTTPDGQHKCFAFTPLGGVGVVFGEPFLQQFYVAHDLVNSRLGFATQSC